MSLLEAGHFLQRALLVLQADASLPELHPAAALPLATLDLPPQHNFHILCYCLLHRDIRNREMMHGLISCISYHLCKQAAHSR